VCEGPLVELDPRGRRLRAALAAVLVRYNARSHTEASVR
jgi:hypothetical protein